MRPPPYPICTRQHHLQTHQLLFLRERINHERREVDCSSRDLLEILLRLAGLLFESDWALIDRLTFEKALWIGEDSWPRECRKFLRLHKTQHPKPPFPEETTFNLSGRRAGYRCVLVRTEGSEVCGSSYCLAHIRRPDRS